MQNEEALRGAAPGVRSGGAAARFRHSSFLIPHSTFSPRPPPSGCARRMGHPGGKEATEPRRGSRASPPRALRRVEVGAGRVQGSGFRGAAARFRHSSFLIRHSPPVPHPSAAPEGWGTRVERKPRSHEGDRGRPPRARCDGWKSVRAGFRVQGSEGRRRAFDIPHSSFDILPPSPTLRLRLRTGHPAPAARRRSAGRAVSVVPGCAAQSSGRSPSGAILTSRGWKRASGRTSCCWARMTSSMSLYACGASSRPADSSVTPCSRR